MTTNASSSAFRKCWSLRLCFIWEPSHVHKQHFLTVACMSFSIYDQKKGCIVVSYIRGFLWCWTYFGQREIYHGSMHGHNANETYFCSSLSTITCRIKTLSWLYVNKKAGNSTIWGVSWHSISGDFACRTNSNNRVSPVSICMVSVWVLTATSIGLLFTVSAVSSHIWKLHDMSELLSWSPLISSLRSTNDTTTSGEYSSTLVKSVPPVSTSNNTRAAWLLTPVLCNTSNTISDKCNCHATRLSVVPKKWRVHFDAS